MVGQSVRVGMKGATCLAKDADASTRAVRGRPKGALEANGEAVSTASARSEAPESSEVDRRETSMTNGERSEP